MAGKTISMGKRRPLSEPWLTISDGTFTTKVLKAYTEDPNKPFARWMVAIRSPFTFGGFDQGDSYVRDISGVVIQRDPSVPDAAIPKRFLAGVR